MNNELKLLACPFCGSPAEHSGPTMDRQYYNVACSNEDCPIGPDTDWHPLNETVIKRWNTRTPPPTVWYRASEKLPTEADGDWDGRVWWFSELGEFCPQLCEWSDFMKEIGPARLKHLRWTPTNLTKPKPPEV